MKRNNEDEEETKEEIKDPVICPIPAVPLMLMTIPTSLPGRKKIGTALGSGRKRRTSKININLAAFIHHDNRNNNTDDDDGGGDDGDDSNNKDGNKDGDDKYNDLRRRLVKDVSNRSMLMKRQQEHEIRERLPIMTSGAAAFAMAATLSNSNNSSVQTRRKVGASFSLGHVRQPLKRGLSAKLGKTKAKSQSFNSMREILKTLDLENLSSSDDNSDYDDDNNNDDRGKRVPPLSSSMLKTKKRSSLKTKKRENHILSTIEDEGDTMLDMSERP